MKFGTRLTVVATIFLVMFGALGMRLWFVQVAEGARIARIAEDQNWIEIATQPPRGDIVDRAGVMIATSRFVPEVVIDRRFVDPDDVEGLVQRLSSLLDIPADEIRARYEAAGVNGRIQLATIEAKTAYAISEQLGDLPGTSIEKLPERVYLTGPTMAHVVGHLGLPDQADLEARPDLDPNLRVGKLGVERVYDDLLQGTPGEIAIQVNRRSEVVAERPPVPARQGNTLILTLDLHLQEIVESALEAGVALSNLDKDAQRALGETVNSTTERAAAVVLDARTFEILALASFPDFDPSLFVSGIDPDTFAGIQETQAFNNLAVSGLYPPASTFKAVTYVAAIEESLPLAANTGTSDPANGLVHCNGTLQLPGFEEGSPQIFRDWYNGDKGWLDLHGAFEQSCNMYFWTLALGTWRAYKETPRESIIQDWARSLGFGAATGIDLTGEAEGIVPDRALFEQWKQFQVENPDSPARLDPSRLDLAGGPFLGGDLMNVAIGQGELVATPLQAAMAYAVIANGGTVLRPYVVSEVRDRQGEVVRRNSPEVVRRVEIDPATTASFLADLNRVVTRGTASGAFAGFGSSLDRVGGKTGTGQTIRNKDNHAWFAGVGPIDDPRWVVVVLIDEGGSGGRVAAPVARHIMQYLMGENPTPIAAGDHTN
jgi:penicillin-binding protein 2